MFRLEAPYYFFLLLLIPLLIIGMKFYANYSNKIWDKLGNKSILNKSLYVHKKNQSIVKYVFYTSIFFAILSMINPQFGQKKEKVKSQSAEIMIALDVSQSMMAEDIKPNRLSRAKIWIKQFTDRFPSEKIGLISFAANAYLQSPLTNDVATINLLSSIADPSLASIQGTSLTGAIDLAIKSFPSHDGHQKLLILISDGEDHEGEVISKAEEAAREGITIACLPVGTPEGANIPILTPSGMDIKRDREGNPVTTKPDYELMQKICAATGGMMLDLNQGFAVFDQLKDKIKTLLKKEMSYQSFNEFESYYQWPLFLAIVSIFIALYFIEKSKQP